MNDRKLAEAGLIYRVEVGSRTSGINAGGGDIDHIGVTLEPPRTVTGLGTFEQYQYRDAAQRPHLPGETNRSEANELDLTIYSARKFARLAAAGNPSVLETLFSPVEAIVFENSTGWALRVNADRFVSKLAGLRYRGYMTSQLNALTGVSKTHTNRPELVEEFGYDCKFAAHALRLGLQGIELMQTGNITLPIPEPALSLLRDVRQGKSTLPLVVEWARALAEQLDDAILQTHLPERADLEWIDTFLHKAHMSYWAQLKADA